jgi:hypothetical protein
MSRLFSRRKRMMEDLDRDIRDYIERETQDNVDRGMTTEEARWAAVNQLQALLPAPRGQCEARVPAPSVRLAQPIRGYPAD